MHGNGAVLCWLIANGDFIGKYGLGLVRPYERLTPYIRDAYLTEGADPASWRRMEWG